MLQPLIHNKLDYEILVKEADIERLTEEWRALHARSGRSPFSDYDLFMIWWRIIGKKGNERSLHVVTGRVMGQLVAVLPLTVWRTRGLRILQAAGYRATNYADMLAADPAQAIELWQAAQCSPYYDFADIRDVYPESICFDALSSFAQKRDLTDAYYLNFEWKSGKEWIASLPSHTRGNYTRCLRRLEEKGKITFEVYRDELPPAAATDDLVKKKVAWSIARNKAGLFEHPEVPAFLHALSENAVKKKTYFLGVLKCDGQIIAYNQGFIDHDVMLGVFWTYDPEWSRYSPGNLVLINSAIWAIDNGLKGLDFRQGASQFKRLHSNQIRHCAEFTFHGSFRGWLIENAYMMARRMMRMSKSGADTAPAKAD